MNKDVIYIHHKILTVLSNILRFFKFYVPRDKQMGLKALCSLKQSDKERQIPHDHICGLWGKKQKQVYKYREQIHVCQRQTADQKGKEGQKAQNPSYIVSCGNILCHLW